ncbi:MAG: GNAT family N-acetyltransferase [Erysipelotrichaceae bacterium]|nr:GNAT family N-acetyltransferase [Erysipelotrichaceae bacterium]MDY5251859.1 GNAT family N-acetyltransferase [Erysipelotrichaceae bacterium]
MTLKLVKATIDYKKQIIDMLEEWTTYNQEHPESNHSPASIFKNSYEDFEYYCQNIDILAPKNGLVPSSTYFCYDDELDMMVGAINIRHYLNDHLLLHAGHIGDGVRPSARRKGYATKMIKLALTKCRELNIDKVLLVCDKTNIGSAKSIIKNGGILENEIISDDGTIEQRYWIDLTNANY